MSNALAAKEVDEARALPAEKWAGWLVNRGIAFDDYVGPFYYRLQDNGSPACAMRCEAKHLNKGGTMHGGALMTFADYAMYVIASSALNETPAVTVTFNSEFVGGVALNTVVECSGEVVRNSRSLVFIRGLLATSEGPVMSFSGVLKKMRAGT